ncbi:hypothetical protein TD95_001781 [Thielaviopsis punctulata]|uniref:N(4)-(Beta-N-acetylglucosaminyl)-L-asparaginase n=1 Tax=Thielaviopsis punctulata TaxID=72032 RepID=A0A0F4ZKE3_9PEZI|nr:hypothetical protein TD95_001781 [Thielaviopsis punctulata]
MKLSPSVSGLLALAYFIQAVASAQKPLAINTWGGPFTATTDKTFLALKSSSSALDAVEIGAAACETNQCDGTVGYGGSPDEQCETTLDAMIMDGTTMNAGAVAGLRRVKNAVGVARMVLEHTDHTLLVGDQATEFAIQHGFSQENLSTHASQAKCEAWKQAKCQPNFRVGVSPDSSSSCGPYEPLLPPELKRRDVYTKKSHDTVSVIAISENGEMAAATSTNGASHKIPGRVGDGPIVGSGSYVDGDVGGCGSTGDGDLMMRFLPCYQAVENLRRGMTPTLAAEDALRRILRKFPNTQAGLLVVSKDGTIGAAGSNWAFTYSWRAGDMAKTEEVRVVPITAHEEL